jgi:diadenosine tetraphosphate (Ap4A) HIT family hydrolase
MSPSPVDHSDDPTIIDCAFCHRISVGHLMFDGDIVAVFRDAFPVSPGHCHIISRRHEPDYFKLSRLDRDSMWDGLETVVQFLSQEYGAEGFNIGVNVGAAAGQSVPHANIHVIPRYTNQPGGGLRWVTGGENAPYKQRRGKCGFCKQVNEGDVTRAVGECVVVPDAFPIIDGHRHVIPRDHYSDFLAIPEEIRDEMWDETEEIWQEMQAEGAEGVNLGLNIGSAAGQQTDHVNIHMVPRRIGDGLQKGGIRWVREGHLADWESGMV